MEEMAKKEITRQQLITRAKDLLDEPALTFFASQLRNARKCCRGRGRRWTYNDKIIALSLYHQSPRAYRFCQSIFALPSVSSLRRWLSNIEVRPGFPANVFQILADKVDGMSERDKLCVITFN